ncbi:ABC transporter substrate-binding protein [Billgrantia aerodenitrificans]|uniref:ABC transporter substrate-binding protein n=1 Tax=Billgrantia aerodenitrificans TaxID=2733483 RepID=A0ABS9ANR0_9GAMM|nr:ABC transporter substrate-binding protein [Halomonas aerodenitrificans]MCE8023213.1 ABC transporter substrate-binding protein [Halomonas aerodenitrificans]
MKSCILLLAWLIMASMVHAGELYRHAGRQHATTEAPRTLVIHGAADHPAVAPLFEAFLESHPAFEILYTEFSTLDLYHHFIDHHPATPDLVMSPAMDLQIKLVNDGYALPYQSVHTEALPDWAKWRNEVFGFTYEPIVIALNTQVLQGEPLPQSRTQLINLIRTLRHRFHGRIGLLDIETVGLGYLTWTHDSQQSRTYGRLIEVFGSLQARLYPNSSTLLEAVDRGEVMVAYNVLGSYARDWAQRNDDLAVILPTDYTSVIMRSAFIPKAASRLAEAQLFLDFLLSTRGQQVLANASSLNPIDERVTGPNSISNLRRSTQSPLRPIPFGLELLLQTDDAKRHLMLEEWSHSIESSFAD